MIIDCPACNERHVVLDRADGTPMRCECGHALNVPTTEDPAIKCSNCGANPPAGSRHCPFCDAHLASLRCGRCMTQSVEGDRHCRACGHEHGAFIPQPKPRPDHVLDCPRCDNPLRTTVAGNATIDDCERCGGVWLDLNVFALALRQETNSSTLVAAIEALKPVPRLTGEIVPAEGARFYIPCPHCGTTMDRRQFAKVSRVIIDVCKEHGVWLDHDELPRIIRFVADGHLETVRRQQIDEQVATLTNRRSRSAQTLSSASGHSGSHTDFGSGLIEVVAGVLALLLK